MEVGWIAGIIIGGIAGWLAEQFMKSNMGLLMNIVLGMVGAAIADAILSAFGIGLGGWLGYLIAVRLAEVEPGDQPLEGTLLRRQGGDDLVELLLDVPAQPASHAADHFQVPRTDHLVAALAMAVKLIESAQRRWRMVNAPHLVALVSAGARFERGVLVERPETAAA